MFVENKRRTLTWSMFLSLLFLFMMDHHTRPFLMASGVICDDLSNILFDNNNVFRNNIITHKQTNSMLGGAKEMMHGLMEK